MSLRNSQWVRWESPVQAGLEFMLQGEDWHYKSEEIRKVVEWCRENLTDPDFFWMTSDDIQVCFSDNYTYCEWGSGRLCIETKSEEDAIAFKLRWL